MICFPPDVQPGHFPLESLPNGWMNRRNLVKNRLEIVSQNDRLRYQQEPMSLIAFKCMGLFLFVLPFYMTIYTILHLIRLPVISYVHRSISLSMKQVIAIVRIPFYWLALQFSALLGIFRPLEGRAWFAHFEKRLHGGVERRDAANFYDRLDVVEECKKTLANENEPAPFYAAICFQPYGKLSSRLISN